MAREEIAGEHAVESPYAWARLCVSLALMTFNAAGVTIAGFLLYRASGGRTLRPAAG
jgi:hypothetical protein